MHFIEKKKYINKIQIPLKFTPEGPTSNTCNQDIMDLGVPMMAYDSDTDMHQHIGIHQRKKR